MKTIWDSFQASPLLFLLLFFFCFRHTNSTDFHKHHSIELWSRKICFFFWKKKSLKHSGIFLWVILLPCVFFILFQILYVDVGRFFQTFLTFSQFFFILLAQHSFKFLWNSAFLFLKFFFTLFHSLRTELQICSWPVSHFFHQLCLQAYFWHAFVFEKKNKNILANVVMY